MPALRFSTLVIEDWNTWCDLDELEPSSYGMDGGVGVSQEKNWWENAPPEDKRCSDDSGDPGPANRQLHGLSPVFAQIAHLTNLDAEAQRALVYVFMSWGIEALSGIMPAPQQFTDLALAGRAQHICVTSTVPFVA